MKSNALLTLIIIDSQITSIIGCKLVDKIFSKQEYYMVKLNKVNQI